MKFLILSLTLLLVASACTPKDMRNNKHDDTPIYEQNPSVNRLSAQDSTEVDNVIKANRTLVDSGDNNNIITALENMEKYVLNIENLTNPEIHHMGVLRKDYRTLMDLYGYAMTLALSKSIRGERIDKLLHNYQVTIFSTCNVDNIDCRNAAAFQGTYGVNILNFILSRDIKTIKDKLPGEKPTLNRIKDIIFGLYVLKNFDESGSNIHGDLFITFSSVFFTTIDIETNKDSLISRYLLDLQNIMVRPANNNGSNSNTCTIFDAIDPFELKKKSSVLNSNFIAQLSTHFYECNTAQEIINRIVQEETTNKNRARLSIDNNGIWSGVKNDYYSRSYILEKAFPSVVNNLSINKDIPLQLIHLYDQIFYGKINNTELDALLGKFSADELAQFIEFAEQYSQENFVYLMQFTFSAFNSALEQSFEAHQTINKEFVQSTYDSLWATVGDVWVDYKTNVARLSSGLSNVYVKLNASQRLSLKPTYDALKDKKLEKANVNEIINLAVSYPILLATNYFSGVDGGGTMKIRVTWVSGVDNTLEISTIKPLRGFFVSSSRNFIPLLDFGYLSFNPNEYERSVGLAMALKTGFFDVVNFDLGKENKGLKHNLKLFFAKYVEDNKEYAEFNRKEINELKKVKDTHWHKVSKFCSNPLTSERRVTLDELYMDMYLSSKEANSSISTRDLEYVDQVLSVKERLSMIDREISRIKRTYKVFVEALKEQGLYDSDLDKTFQDTLVPHFRISKQLLTATNELLENLGKDQVECLVSLTKVQRFQQNILIRQTVEYLAKVHSSMNLIRSLESKIQPDMTAEQIKTILSSESAGDSYDNQVIQEAISSKALIMAEEQLGLKGNALLAEALNLILAPHNLSTADFGYRIRELSKMSSSLNNTEDFLGRRGGFDKEKFMLSDFDQKMRVREEIYDLKAPVSLIKEYFENDSFVLEEVKGLSDNTQFRLNRGLNIHIQNLKFYKDKLGTDERRAKVNYTASREDFIAYSMERLFGNNQEGQQIFNWLSAVNHSNPLTRAFSKLIEAYKYGPMRIPLKLEDEDSDVRCALESPFDSFGTIEGCEQVEISATTLNNMFLNIADLLYLSDKELLPLIKAGNGDELDSIIQNVILHNNNIDVYKPDAIKRYFSYYKYKEYPNQWTWFDQFLARTFTTVTVRDQNMQTLNMSVILGTAEYTEHYQQVVKARLEDMLLPIHTSPRKVLRSFYRSTLLKNILIADRIIEDVVSKEHHLKAEDLPKVALKYKDIPNIQTSDKEGWVELDVDTWSEDRLKLLGGYNYEVSQFQNQQITVFKEYSCDLLPIVGDADFSVVADQWIDRTRRSCETQVRRWLQYKNCEVDKKREQLFENYNGNCPEELKGN